MRFYVFLSLASARRAVGGAVVCLFGLLACPLAYAARPMVTDDARLTEEKACQVETWLQSYRHGLEYWLLPACNFTGNFELTLGGTLGKETARRMRVENIVLQGKTLLKALEPNGWAAGVAFGNAIHPTLRTSHRLLGELYAYGLGSFSLFKDILVIHTNLGWLREKESGKHRMTWGLGTETQLSKRLWVVAETFGQNFQRPFYQLGIRYWLMPERFQVDVTYGNQLGTRTHAQWFSFGLRVLPPAFLP